MQHQTTRQCSGQMRILNVILTIRIIITTTTLTAGWNKKMEALLHRVLNELSEMREEIKFFKANKTIGTYKYINSN